MGHNPNDREHYMLLCTTVRSVDRRKRCIHGQVISLVATEPENEILLICVDMNEHVEERSNGFEDIHKIGYANLISV